MAKGIIIFKTIFPRIVRRVNINQLHPPRKLLLQGVQSQQVVPFDKQIVGNHPVFIPMKIRYGMLALAIITPGMGKRFGSKELVYLIASQHFVVKHFTPFVQRLFVILATGIETE